MSLNIANTIIVFAFNIPLMTFNNDIVLLNIAEDFVLF